MVTDKMVEALRAAYDKVSLWPEKRMPGVDISTLGEGFTDLLALRNLIPDVLAALATVNAEPVAWMDGTGTELHKLIMNYQKQDMIQSKEQEDFDQILSESNGGTKRILRALATPAPADERVVEAAIRSACDKVIDALAKRFVEKPGSVDDYADYMRRIPDAALKAQEGGRHG